MVTSEMMVVYIKYIHQKILKKSLLKLKIIFKV
jgi:hypothetical protein